VDEPVIIAGPREGGAVTGSHHGSFETVRRVRDGALLWLATCGCGRCWTGPDYESVDGEWRKHVNAEKEIQQ